MTNATAYLITFHTYGTWLHGDLRGSVDSYQNRFDSPPLPADCRRESFASSRMKHSAVNLDLAQRSVVEKTINQVCAFRGWELHAINVRSNHVHVVVAAELAPERIMNDLKSWCTRRMVECGLFEKGRPAWVRHGSTEYLFDETSIATACDYVVDGQGPIKKLGQPTENRAREEAR